ncbi:hypothetical protein PLICRDRAFT_113669 [Plicaturopsis crispa FD-325 SS-3]|nr:hypothetical protein PLICRDRAFT_113669 [Plicaturopsis crispa FD-325 SS-3]
MMFTSLCAALLLTLTSSPASVGASCLPCARGIRGNDGTDSTGNYRDLARRVVYDPRITSPAFGTTWEVGSQVQVTWDTSDMPAHVTNPKGRLVLGYLKGDDQNEHLDFDHPLADGFDIAQGHVEVEVPEVQAGQNYIVVLFGDSGNRSPSFTIE